MKTSEKRGAVSFPHLILSTRVHSTRSSHTCVHNTHGSHTHTQHTQLTHMCAQHIWLTHMHTAHAAHTCTHAHTAHTQRHTAHTAHTCTHTAHTHAHSTHTCTPHMQFTRVHTAHMHVQSTHTAHTRVHSTCSSHMYTAHTAHTCTQHTQLTHSTHSSHTCTHSSHTCTHSTHSSHTRAHTHITRRPVNLTFQSLTLYRRLGAFSNTGLQDPQFPQRILRCLEGGGPPQSHWADFQNPRPLGKRRRGSDNCSSLKNKDNLRDDREPPNPPPAGDRGRQRPWDTANGLRRGHSGATVPRSAGRGAVPTVSRRQVHRGAAAGPPLTGSWPPIFNPSGKSEAVPEDLGSEP